MFATALLPLILAANFTPSFDERVTAPTGELKLGIGRLSQPLPGSLAQAARTFALSRRGELGLPVTSDLGQPTSFGTRFGASFHLSQQVGGVDVYNARVVVTVDRERRVVQLSSGAVRYRQAVLDWRMRPEEAMRLAAREVPMAMLQPSGEPYGGWRQQVFPAGEDVHAGYFVWVPSLDPLQNWHVAIDAVTGAVLFKENRVYRAADDAEVYESSPGHLDAGVGVTPTITVQLQHADGGSMIASSAIFGLPDAGTFTLTNDAGKLMGTQLVAFGCCPNAGCDTGPDAGAARAAGNAQLYGYNVTYDVVLCERVMRASNDPALNPAGSYVYTPTDPPTLQGGQPVPVSQSEPADSDPFAEVHAFYHVNSVYDFVRSLSHAAAPLFPTEQIQPFQMRDERRVPRRVPAVWTNVTLPDFEEIQRNFNPLTMSTRADRLSRIDNAVFLGRENFQRLVLPEYFLDVDAILLFQGPRVDYAYDAPVVWHEFGHGVITATAGLGAFAIDSRSANDEGGAMHEGLADYLAAAFGQNPEVGAYVGPRISSSVSGGLLEQDVPVRNLENALACPEVLWGEPHQDSKHFSAALWQARKEHFQGTDLGRTFDAAIYAALVSMDPTTNFAGAAATIASHVERAFPGVAQAGDKMRQIFDQRGVTNCSKVIDLTDVTEPRPLYGIGGNSRAGMNGQIIPGPYQIKLRTPQGARRVSISGRVDTGPFGGAPSVRLLARAGSPITFTRGGNTLTNDATKTVLGSIIGGVLDAAADIDVPCGATSEVYLSIGTSGGGNVNIQGLTASFQPATTCDPQDGGTDGGTDAGQGGGQVVSVPHAGDNAGRVPEGCGCSGAGAGLAALALLGLLGLARRRATP